MVSILFGTKLKCLNTGASLGEAGAGSCAHLAFGFLMHMIGEIYPGWAVRAFEHPWLKLKRRPSFSTHEHWSRSFSRIFLSA